MSIYGYNIHVERANPFTLARVYAILDKSAEDMYFHIFKGNSFCIFLLILNLESRSKMNSTEWRKTHYPVILGNNWNNY